MAVKARRTEDQVIAAATAGHRMAGMEPTAEDIAAARRVLRGKTTVAAERDRVLRELHAR